MTTKEFDKRNRKLIELAQNGNMKARNEAVILNEGLVVKVAQSLKHYTIEYDDMLQEGRVGLMKAIEKYDLSKETVFSTYAQPWIEHYIRRYFENQGRVKRIPSNVVNAYIKYKKIKRELEKKLEREVTNKEVADYMGITVDKVEKYIIALTDVYSLNDYSTDKENCTYIESIEDREVITKFREVESIDMKLNVMKALNTLDDRRKDILLLKFGFNNEPLSHPQIARKYGITVERVGQIVRSSFKRLSKLDYIQAYQGVM